MTRTSLSNPDARQDLVVVRLNEWQTVGPKEQPALRGQVVTEPITQELIASLHGRLEIRPTFDGIKITSSSFVGRVDVGNLRILVQPKLDRTPLTSLLQYAYGLHKMGMVEHTVSDVAKDGILEMLVAMLVTEVERVLAAGVPSRYVRREESLASPRGALLINEIARRGGVREAQLPCRHYLRDANWHLNRVMKSGLELALRLTSTSSLRQKLWTLIKRMDGIDPLAVLREAEVDRAVSELTRITTPYQPTLTLIRLLLNSQGFTFEQQQKASTLPGFLFDMNAFFQRLLSRFLRESLRGFRIVDEKKIRGVLEYASSANPQRLRAPSPRPDYALFYGERLLAYLDAKYRDIWRQRLPSKWLYQLTIYAIASPTHLSVLLYPSTDGTARDARIIVRDPLIQLAENESSVVIRPVNLLRLAGLLSRGAEASLERTDFAMELVALAPLHSTPSIAHRAQSNV
jgi:5-methylcytosine-specific restriction enzyme subunit McrC